MVHVILKAFARCVLRVGQAFFLAAFHYPCKSGFVQYGKGDDGISLWTPSLQQFVGYTMERLQNTWPTALSISEAYTPRSAACNF